MKIALFDQNMPLIWLANSEKIIAPKNWFGGDCVNKSVSDMEFGDWTWL